MKTERFFHVRLANKPSKGGATVRVVSEGKTDRAGRPLVRVQVAHCSNKDSFWRAMGRLRAKVSYSKEVVVDRLPEVLWSVQNRVYSRALVAPTKREYTDWSFTTKYFEPIDVRAGVDMVETSIREVITA